MTGDHIYINAAQRKLNQRGNVNQWTKQKRVEKSKYCHQDNSIAASKAYAQHGGFTEPDDMENNVSQEY